MAKKVALGILLLIVLSSTAFSQGSAQLGGVVTDPSRALMPGVSIVATNTETSVATTTITNESGAYNFASLQPGASYKITASLPGFQTKTINNLGLSAGTTNRADFQLAVATTATTVEVHDASPMTSPAAEPHTFNTHSWSATLW